MALTINDQNLFIINSVNADYIRPMKTKAPRNQLETKRLRYIVEVSKSGSITTAAETLSITQSALSQNIAEVEDVLGVKLFNRLPRGVLLTEAGEIFVARAKSILYEVDELFTNVLESQQLVTGRLKIGVTPAGFIAHLRRAITDIATEYPGIAIETVSGSADQLCPMLVHGEVNLVVGMTSTLSRWKELQIKQMAPLHVAILVRKNHPLASLENPTEQDLLKYPVIGTNSQTVVSSIIAPIYARNGMPYLPRYLTDDPEVNLRLVTTTDAFWPLMDPNPELGYSDDYQLLRGIYDIPDIHLGYATNAKSMNPNLINTFDIAFANYLQRFKQS